jgi:hypothetical protein
MDGAVALAAVGVKPLNVAALTKRVHSITEQPKAVAGHRGIECTNIESYSECRAKLILLALQLVPLLGNKDIFPLETFPGGLTINHLLESGEEEFGIGDGNFTREATLATGSAASAAGSATTASAGDAIDLHVRLRARTLSATLECMEVRNNALHALAKYAVTREQSGVKCMTTAVAEAVEKKYKAMRDLYEPGGKYHGQIPVSTTHLVQMGILPAMWALEYKVKANFQLTEGEKAHAATLLTHATAEKAEKSASPKDDTGGGAAGFAVPSASSPGARRGGERDAAIKGSLSTLWWPPSTSAITFASAVEIMRQHAAHKEHAKAADADKVREQRARELRARMAASGSGAS